MEPRVGGFSFVALLYTFGIFGLFVLFFFLIYLAFTHQKKKKRCISLSM